MSTVVTRKRQRQDIEKLRRQDMLLGIIYLFSPLHREISIQDIHKSVSQFQEKLQLGYSFSKHFNYSDTLMGDLEDLLNTGLLQEYAYRQDSFSPVEKLKLTVTGVDRGKETVTRLPVELLEYLEDAQ